MEASHRHVESIVPLNKSTKRIKHTLVRCWNGFETRKYKAAEKLCPKSKLCTKPIFLITSSFSCQITSQNQKHQFSVSLHITVSNVRSPLEPACLRRP